jgi:hypothetical protein
MEGAIPDNTRQQIGKIFKANDEQLNKLFSGNPVKIKTGVDVDTASKYRVAFRNAGAIIDIKPSASSSYTSDKSPSVETSSQKEIEELTLLPPNTGSLIDCAKEVTPQQTPNTEHISLASPGTVIDESPEPEPAEIDISSLSVSPANSGTLEDCKKDVEPYPIPDISHLDIDEA